MNIMKIIALTLLLLLAGCASTGNKAIMNADFMKSLQIGATTRDEAKAILGEPQYSGFQGGGEVLRYAGTDRSVNAASFIPIVDIAAGRQIMRARVVDLYFGSDGKLADIRATSDMSERIMPIGTAVLGVAAVGAAAGVAASRPYGCGYYNYNPGKAVVNTIPTGGGGSMTTIKWYK